MDLQLPSPTPAPPASSADSASGSSGYLRRANHRLFEVRPSEEPVLNGMRALAILMVLAFHILYPLSEYIPLAEFVDFAQSNPIAGLSLQGHFGVDIFFVLSGFLVTRAYLARPAGSTLASYLRRRVIRLIPPYLFVMLVAFFVFPDHCRSMWSNLLLVNNFLPAHEVCVFWSWSLAIEFQFYLALPALAWGLAHVRAVPVFVSVLVAGVVLNVGYLWSSGSFASTWDFLNAFYFPTQFRVGSIVYGMLAAYLLDSNATALRAVFADTTRRRVAYLVAAASFFVPIAFPSSALVGVYDNYSLIPALYEGAYRYIFAFSPFLLILLVHAGAGQPLQRWLGHRAWIPVARLSYVGYLVNFIVFRELYHALYTSRDDLLLIAALALPTVATVTYLTYLLVEAPFVLIKERK